MCGIAGIVSLKQKELTDKDTSRLNHLLRSMEHRGPDGEGGKKFASCQFGMKRLAIIDIGGGQQPISNETDDIWVVLNGEIYNYIELREELLRKGHIFKTHSDTEVLVHLYEEYGKDFVLKLNGMFGIFLFDRKKEEKFLFRDHIGIKPIFYTEYENRFIFSSELAGLAQITTSKISEESILAYLALSYVPKPDTIYQGIHKLMPGSAIHFEASGKINHYRYWEINNQVDHAITAEDAKRCVHELLVESNSIQLRSDTDFAISLSGGIDSSTVLAFASLSYSKALNTISMEYEGKDEAMDSHYAKLMAKRYKTNHLSITLRRDRFNEYIDEVIPFIDEPIADSAMIPNYIISKEARKRGIKVLLSGAGGDELFGGYHRHFKPPFLSAKGLIHFPPALRKFGYWLLNMSGKDLNNERLLYPALGFASEINGLNYSFLTRNIMPKAKKIIIEKVMDHYTDIYADNEYYAHNRMLNDTRNYLVDNILSLSDKATMAASVEGRFPLIDYRLVQFALSLPETALFPNNQPKGLLKEVISPYVPAEILYREKEGFNAPMEQWFGGGGKLNEVKEYIIKNSGEKLSSIINPEVLRADMEQAKTSSKTFENIYSLYFLNKWMDYHAR